MVASSSGPSTRGYLHRQDAAMPSPVPSRRAASTLWEWRTAIAEWKRWAAREGGYPATTIRTRHEHLTLFAKSARVGPWSVEVDDLLDWFTDRTWATNTYLSRRTTIRHFYKWACEQGKVDRSPALAIPSKRPPEPNPTPTPDRVYDAALEAADDRTRLMLLLAAGHGLRRGEVAVVCPMRDLVEDLDGWSLLVHGKGSRTRLVPLEEETSRLLLAAPPGYLFPGRIDGHLSPQYVGVLVSRALEGAWTMHKLRHRAATYFQEDADNDMRVVQVLLGHASLNTTMLYVPENKKRMRQAVNGRRSSTDAVTSRKLARRP